MKVNILKYNVFFSLTSVILLQEYKKSLKLMMVKKCNYIFSIYSKKCNLF